MLYGFFGGEMSKMSKRIKLIAFSLLMAVLLTSCSKGEFSNAFWKMVSGTNIVLDFLTPDKEPEKTNAELVLQYIQEKNTDAIYDMLCKRLKKQPNVRKRIEETFDFYEGKSVSYDLYYGESSGGWDNGVCVDEHITPQIKNLKTDNDKIYRIPYHEYVIYKENPKCVGITYIRIFDESSDDMVQIGEHVY